MGCLAGREGARHGPARHDAHSDHRPRRLLLARIRSSKSQAVAARAWRFRGPSRSSRRPRVGRRATVTRSTGSTSAARPMNSSPMAASAATSRRSGARGALLCADRDAAASLSRSTARPRGTSDTRTASTSRFKHPTAVSRGLRPSRARAPDVLARNVHGLPLLRATHVRRRHAARSADHLRLTRDDRLPRKASRSSMSRASSPASRSRATRRAWRRSSRRSRSGGSRWSTTT